MRDVFYHSFVNFMGMFLWRGELIGQAILPGQGSAVLVANLILTPFPSIQNPQSSDPSGPSDTADTSGTFGSFGPLVLFPFPLDKLELLFYV